MAQGVSEVRTLLVSEFEVLTFLLSKSVYEVEKISLSEFVSEVMSESVRGKVTYFVKYG